MDTKFAAYNCVRSDHVKGAFHHVSPQQKTPLHLQSCTFFLKQFFSNLSTDCRPIFGLASSLENRYDSKNDTAINTIPINTSARVFHCHLVDVSHTGLCCTEPYRRGNAILRSSPIRCRNDLFSVGTPGESERCQCPV